MDIFGYQFKFTSRPKVIPLPVELIGAPVASSPLVLLVTNEESKSNNEVKKGESEEMNIYPVK